MSFAAYATREPLFDWSDEAAAPAGFSRSKRSTEFGKTAGQSL
jgi:hypothetical protein